MKKFSFILIVLALFSLQGCINISEGERVGTIVKFSKKGVFIKTWEGEMVLGGSGASGNNENTWPFTVEDERVVEEVKASQKKAQVVTLAYKQEMFTAPWRGDTKHFIVDVEE